MLGGGRYFLTIKETSFAAKIEQKIARLLGAESKN
jgi:hypothetical protein